MTTDQADLPCICSDLLVLMAWRRPDQNQAPLQHNVTLANFTKIFCRTSTGSSISSSGCACTEFNAENFKQCIYYMHSCAEYLFDVVTSFCTCLNKQDTELFCLAITFVKRYLSTDKLIRLNFSEICYWHLMQCISHRRETHQLRSGQR